MYLKTFFALTMIAAFSHCVGQEPKYTKKHFVKDLDTLEFKYINQRGDGFFRTYITANVTIWDLDDDSTTYVKGGDSVLLCIEGRRKENKREGLITYYLIDQFNHSKKYKFYEQNYLNDKLNGEWRTFNLRGGLVYFQTYTNGILNGPSKTYSIDGKTVIEEKEYKGSELSYIWKQFYDNRKIMAETSIKNGKLDGVCKKFYENGNIREHAEFKNDVFNGTRKYFYENGQVWIEQTYIDGKSWAVVANYTAEGKKRDPGTLKNGNGTIIFYNDDGSIREVQTFANGILKE